jgi:ABC-type sulfate transport system permease component
MKDKIIGWINWFLTFDFFFVIASFLWFLVALVTRDTKLNLGFELWMSLWEPLFMPAIGLLMAGALAIGLINWILKRWDAWQDQRDLS